jgi:hypothetical protein
MKYLTEKNINNYLINNYGYNKHNNKKLLKASRITAKQYKVKAKDIFFFMIENEPIRELRTHSYDFNTSGGREIKETFKNNYYE